MTPAAEKQTGAAMAAAALPWSQKGRQEGQKRRTEGELENKQAVVS